MTTDFEIILYGGSGIDNGSYRYRVLNLKEQLDEAGIRSKIVTDLQSLMKIENPNSQTIFLLHRIAWDSELSVVKKFAIKHRIPLVFDIDDYVFDTKINNYVRGVEVLSEQKKKEYSLSVERYRRALLECDFAIASTDYLSDKIKEIGIRSLVHRNALSVDTLFISEKVRSEKNNSDDHIILGYFSGTHTHNYDFLECSKAVIEILNKYKNVKLMIVGPLDLPNTFDKFQNRIIRHDLVDWKKLPELISKVTINLAPLERNNPFCDAKSELKYFEAAIVNVPTIATPTESFQHAIANGKTGFLASNENEWVYLLKKLIESKDLREEIVKNAKDDTYSRYTVNSRSKQVKTLFENILSEYSSKDVKNVEKINRQYIVPKNKPLKISFVSSTPEAGQGGFRTITRNCRYLSKSGHDVTLYVDPGSKFKNSQEIKDFLKKHYEDVNYNVILGHNFSETDVLIATFWTTAYNVFNFKKAKTKIYLVQDFEPYFYEMGYDYVMSENTYKLGMYHITTFPWLPPLLKRNYNGVADYFLPPIDRETYMKKNTEKADDKIQIAFYARPDQPRRCYKLGIDALSLVCDRVKNVNIVLFGSNKVDSKDIPFPHVNMKSLPTLKDLANLYNNSDIGIVFSTTNPSLLSFEMMMCGCPIVDLDLESNRLSYGSLENVVLCKPTPSDLANKIMDLINDEQKRKSIAQRGYEYVQKFPSEEGSAQKFEEIMINAHMRKIPVKDLQIEEESVVDVGNTIKEFNVEEITSDRVIKQSFISELDGLHKISLYLATYARKNNCKITIVLQDSQGFELARNDINAYEIEDNSWTTFSFPEIKNSKSKTFSLKIFSKNASSGDAITIYASTKKSESPFQFYINDISYDYTICFQTYCRTTSRFTIKETGSDFQQKTTSDLLQILSIKISQNKEWQNSLEGRLIKTESIISKIENEMSTLVDSFIATKNHLNRLDNTIYRYSQTFPLNIGVKFIKKISRNLKD